MGPRAGGESRGSSAECLLDELWAFTPARHGSSERRYNLRATRMPLAPGTRLANYEIVSAIGAGGMGEVYRARDTSLKRDVALKILPESFAADAERLARFQREAEVLASLNHPNIAAIHGLKNPAASSALVMELVEGEDLADRIARGRDPAGRGAADRETDRRGPRSRARAGHRPSRSEAREHQGATRRHGQGARFRSGQGIGAAGRRRSDVADDHQSGADRDRA